MSLSVHRRPGDAAAGKGGPIGARDAATHRHQAPAAAAASASATTSSYSSAPEGAQPASPWHPLPPSLPKRRLVGTSSSYADEDAPGPASRKRTAARMTWPPESTPRRGLAGGALSSPKLRGLTRKEEYLGWLGSLRSGPQQRGADAEAEAEASAPPSPTASFAARVLPPRHGGVIKASDSSTAISSAALAVTPKGRSPASAASLLGYAPSPLSALATASLGARRQLPAAKQPNGSRGASSLLSKPKPPTGTTRALPPLQTIDATHGAPSLQNTDPTPDAPSLQTDPSPPVPFLAAFGRRIFEVLFNLKYHCAAPPPRVIKPTTSEAPLPPHLDAFGQRIVEVLFDLNYGHLGYTGVVLMGVYAGLMELLSGWNTILKFFYVLLLILGAFGLGTGLMAATSIAPTGYTHRVSSVCSRLCTCLSTFVFIIALACHMGSHGYIAGIVLGVMAVCYMLSVWIQGDPAAYGAYTWVWTVIKDLWQRFKRSGQTGPILP
ncbi:unnamed protein product [Urochloa decumbens]|uniref:Uncharacterized protein n=1 Tax=Urochloa decumbens TaxID=240449 RepID=A0ABC9FMS2_9POAL